ncbi:MAG: hypothetical protein HZB17_12535 [Chloroflexi bacterium]|nr:hypothetical protein [Chloroflexota bacterium]
MKVIFDKLAKQSPDVEKEVTQFLQDVKTLEKEVGSPMIIYQDGKSGSYYIKATILASIVFSLLDLDARLDPTSSSSFRANRELSLKNNTYSRLKADTEKGREFNDIIVEYSRDYSAEKPLKVWGGQHRSKAIQESFQKDVTRHHGFRIYLCLSKAQRSDLALISNTHIAVSDDLFDRQLEETLVGTQLRDWCWRVGLLKQGEDFPDQSSKGDKISVKLARTFLVNFFHGKNIGKTLSEKELDKNVYEPYLCESGANLDSKYEEVINKYGERIWKDTHLDDAGKAFAQLHQSQRNTVEKLEQSKKIEKRKAFKNKALTAAVLAGWSYVAGLLQEHPQRLKNLFVLPKSTASALDPLNAKGMSTFKHEKDEKTYRGLGTRSDIKERQKLAQVFLAKSISPDRILDKNLLEQAVSQVVAIKALEKGYSKF